ncbi:MAG: hypothetical protein AAFQ79_09100 [Pseudomonadota bacterium]
MGLQKEKRFKTIDRRSLLQSFCGVCGSALFPSTHTFAQAEDEPFVCSTVIPPIGEYIDLQSSTDNDESIDLGEATVDEALSPQGAARSRLKWLPEHGLPAPRGVIRLGIGFVGDPPDDWKEQVRERALRWTPAGSQIAAKLIFDFSVPLSECQIRISQTGVNGIKPANRSLLGRLARSSRLGDGESTMYIYNISSVEHEFGHALCLTHEHFHEALPITIDRKKAIEYFRRNHGWKPRRTINNLFAPAERCLGDSEWNAESVMGYNIPKEITKEGISLTKSGEIHDRDRKCVDSIYL